MINDMQAKMRNPEKIEIESPVETKLSFNFSLNQSSIFKYWRTRIMYSMMIGYAGYYLLRQNFAMAMPFMSSELGYSKTELGAVISLAAIFYGVGKGLAGYLGDRMNARYMMAFGLVMSAFMNICMGAGSLLTWFMVFWTVNSCFQSLGWPPCARLLNHWFSPKELGTKWALWNSSQQIGSGIVLVSSGYIIEQFGWRYAFYTPGIICILLSLFLLNRLRDTPESLGLPSIEEHHDLVVQKDVSEENMPMRTILFERVLNNKLVWYVCMANFFVYIVRMTIALWAPTFLSELKGSSIKLAGFQAASNELAAVFGGLLAGYLSDKVFKGHRGRVSTIFMLMLGVGIFALWQSPVGATSSHFLIMLGIGFFISGPQVLVGVAASDFASKKAAGTASGLTGTFGYLGTAFAGMGIGVVVDRYGWDMAFLSVIIAAVIGALFFALTWNHRSKVLDTTANTDAVKKA